MTGDRKLKLNDWRVPYHDRRRPVTDFIHVDDEGVRRAATQMSEAADKMVRAANLIDETLARFIVRFEEAVTMIGDTE